ncbi:MAG: hypothetical protein ACREID_05460 [Planctomycetota bacterium]
MRSIVALLLAGLAAGAEEPAPKTDLKPGEVEIGEPGAKIEDPAVARKKVADFLDEYKAEKDEEKRAAVVRKLGEWDHAEILKAALKLVGDRNRFVAIEAAVVVARQRDTAKAGTALHRALQMEKRPDVACALLVALGKVGYAKAFKDAEKWYVKDTTETSKAAARYFGYTKAKDAFRLLAERLEEPRPKNPDDPNNPPASYWEARWKEWNSNLPHVRWALSQIAEGETFERTVEAKEWAEKEGRKLGINW